MSHGPSVLLQKGTILGNESLDHGSLLFALAFVACLIPCMIDMIDMMHMIDLAPASGHALLLVCKRPHTMSAPPTFLITQRPVLIFEQVHHLPCIPIDLPSLVCFPCLSFSFSSSFPWQHQSLPPYPALVPELGEAVSDRELRKLGIPTKGVVGPLPEKGMNLVHLAEFAAYSIGTPYAMIAFLIL
jgi:hypothetical protein